jgi:hypothetical protein
MSKLKFDRKFETRRVAAAVLRDIDVETGEKYRLDATRWVNMPLKSSQNEWLARQAATHMRESVTPTQARAIQAGVKRSLGPVVQAIVKAALAVRKFRHPGGL